MEMSAPSAVSELIQCSTTNFRMMGKTKAVIESADGRQHDTESTITTGYKANVVGRATAWTQAEQKDPHSKLLIKSKDENQQPSHEWQQDQLTHESKQKGV